MSVAEIQSMLTNMGIEMNTIFIDILVKKASNSGNLSLDEQEFMQWIHKIQTLREEDKSDTVTESSKEEDDLRNDLMAAFMLVNIDT